MLYLNEYIKEGDNFLKIRTFNEKDDEIIVNFMEEVPRGHLVKFTYEDLDVKAAEVECTLKDLQGEVNRCYKMLDDIAARKDYTDAAKEIWKKTTEDDIEQYHEIMKSYIRGLAQIKAIMGVAAIFERDIYFERTER